MTKGQRFVAIVDKKSYSDFNCTLDYEDVVLIDCFTKNPIELAPQFIVEDVDLDTYEELL